MTKREDSPGEEEKRAHDSEQATAKREELAPSATDDEEEDDDEDEDDDEAEETAASKRPEPRRAVKAQPSRHGKREQPTKAAAGRNVPLPRVVAFVVVALAAGAAGGWFGHDEQLKARVKAESLAAPAGSGAMAGPCGAWQQKICDSGGKTSAVCGQARGAAELLTSAACETALGMMPATLAKVKAARASCDSLVSKLCKDLPPGSAACDLVKEKTPSFPAARCDEMLQHYDEVLGSLRQMEQQGGPGMGAPGMGRPPMPGQSPH